MSNLSQVTQPLHGTAGIQTQDCVTPENLLFTHAPQRPLQGSIVHMGTRFCSSSSINMNLCSRITTCAKQGGLGFASVTNNRKSVCLNTTEAWHFAHTAYPLEVSMKDMSIQLIHGSGQLRPPLSGRLPVTGAGEGGKG